MKGHQGSVLCLTLSEDKKLLFSSAGDAIVKVFFVTTALTVSGMGCRRIESPVHSLFYFRYRRCLFCRLQPIPPDNIPWGSKYFNTSNSSTAIANPQWYDLKSKPERPRTSSSSFPMRRFNKFFDSAKPGSSSPDQSDADDDGRMERIPLLEIEPRNQVQFAHYGYVYCLHLGSLPHSSEQLLFSGKLLKYCTDLRRRRWRC